MMTHVKTCVSLTLMGRQRTGQVGLLYLTNGKFADSGSEQHSHNKPVIWAGRTVQISRRWSQSCSHLFLKTDVRTLCYISDPTEFRAEHSCWYSFAIPIMLSWFTAAWGFSVWTALAAYLSKCGKYPNFWRQSLSLKTNYIIDEHLWFNLWVNNKIMNHLFPH